MNASELKPDPKPAAAKPAAPRRKSRAGKAFWGLIGLLAVGAIGAVVMAFMTLNQYSHDAPSAAQNDEQEVEILSLDGNNRMVSGNMLPATPGDVDESIVHTDAYAASAPLAELAAKKQAGGHLVDEVAVQAVAKPLDERAQLAQTEAVAAIEKPAKTVKKAEAKPAAKEKAAKNNAHQELDNLF